MKFTKTALDEHVKAFVVHITSLSLNSIPIYPAQEAQIALLVIKKVQIPELDEHIEAFMVHVTLLLTMPIYPTQEAQIVLLVAKKIKIPIKYMDFFKCFLRKKSFNLTGGNWDKSTCYWAAKRSATTL